MRREAGESVAVLGESAAIIASLAEGGVLPDLNGRLSATQRALGLALRALLKDKLVRGFPTVVEYARRIHDRYFPDYEAFEAWIHTAEGSLVKPWANAAGVCFGTRDLYLHELHLLCFADPILGSGQNLNPLDAWKYIAIGCP